MSGGTGFTEAEGVQAAGSDGQGELIHVEASMGEPVNHEQDTGSVDPGKASATPTDQGENETGVGEDRQNIDSLAGDRQVPLVTSAGGEDEGQDQNIASDIEDCQETTTGLDEWDDPDQGNLTATAQVDEDNNAILVEETVDSDAETPGLSD